MADESAKLVWGHWNVDRTARVHSLGQVTFSDDAELGGTVAAIDTSRDPEWRLTARIVWRVVVSVLRPRYGLSILAYVWAQRGLGAARTSAYYAVGPFIGVPSLGRFSAKRRTQAFSQRSA